MSWVVKVGSSYLETLCWLLLSDRQRDAWKFSTREQARVHMQACLHYPDYRLAGVKVVRLRSSLQSSEEK